MVQGQGLAGNGIWAGPWWWQRCHHYRHQWRRHQRWVFRHPGYEMSFSSFPDPWIRFVPVWHDSILLQLHHFIIYCSPAQSGVKVQKFCHQGGSQASCDNPRMHFRAIILYDEEKTLIIWGALERSSHFLCTFVTSAQDPIYSSLFYCTSDHQILDSNMYNLAVATFHYNQADYDPAISFVHLLCWTPFIALFLFCAEVIVKF